jgi:hypothetical protein
VKRAVSADSAKAADKAKVADTAAVADNVSNQLWAIVKEDGSLFRASSGIMSSNRQETGKYLVVIDRDVAGCFFVATLGGDEVGQGLKGTSPSIRTAPRGIRFTFSRAPKERG